MKCLIDNLEFETEKALHIHISRTLKMRIEEYYRKFYPRFDLFDGKPILFKTKDFYFSSLFNTRENLVEYLKKSNDPETLIKEILNARKESKNLEFAPSTVEAKTCILPTPALVQFLGFNYNNLCKECGLSSRYRYTKALEYEDSDSFSIITDTREQSPINFGCKNTITKLDFGDYGTKSHYKGVFIERKSLSDLCGTISGGYDRFKRELDRAKEMDSYLVVCVEQSVLDLMRVDKNPQMKKMKATPEFLSHRIRELYQNYNCVQFLFLRRRSEMASIIKKILLLKTNVKQIDLQWAYDSKILCAN